jgi:hypothetical protein
VKLFGVTLVLLASLPAAAYAQDPTVGHAPAFTVDKLQPAPGPGSFLQTQGGELAPYHKPYLNASLSYADQLLLVRDVRDGSTLCEPVRWRATLDLGVAVGLSESWQAGLAVPLVLAQGGDRLQGLELGDGAGDLRTTTLGDLRVHAKYLFSAPHAEGLGRSVGVAFAVGLPSGDEEHFAGEAGVTAEFQLIVAHRAPSWSLAVNLGPRFRGEEVEFLSPEVTLGNELVYGLAASFALSRDLRGLVELAGVRGDHGVSPIELRAGLRGHPTGVHGFDMGVFVGAGISGDDDLAAPRLRVGVELRWEPFFRYMYMPVIHDTDDDLDGVDNDNDECPYETEDYDRFLDDDGCPDPDNDKDGVLDADDVCPYDSDDRCQDYQPAVRDDDF